MALNWRFEEFSAEAEANPRIPLSFNVSYMFAIKKPLWSQSKWAATLWCAA